MERIPDLSRLRDADDPDRSRFYPPRWKLLLMAVGCALVALICVLPAQADITVMAVLGRLGLFVLGVVGLVLVVRAARPGPTVVVDQEGITDRTALSPTGLVRWDEITVLRKREIGRGRAAERVLEVVLAEPEQFRARPRSWLRRFADGYRRVMKHPDVAIPGSMVSGSMQDIMDAVRQQKPHLEVRELPPPTPKAFRRRPPPGSARW